MPFIIRLKEKKAISVDKREGLERIKEKYNGKKYQNYEDYIKAKKELDDELFQLTGMKTMETCKYGSHMMAGFIGGLDCLIDSAATPEEKSKWQGLRERIYTVFSDAQTKSMEADQNSAFTIEIPTDQMGNVMASYFSKDCEKEIEDALKEMNIAVRDELRKIPAKGNDYENNDFIRDHLEIMLHLSEIALNGNIVEEYTKTDDYMIGGFIGGPVTGVSPYGAGRNANDSPFISEYARFENLVPVHQPAIKGLRLVNANLEYQNKAKKKASREDEIRVREQILIESGDCLYAIDKIQKNMQNEEVKAAFPTETKNAYTDLMGNRSQLNNWAGMARARRKLIVNGWAMTDVVAIGRIAAIGTIAERNIRNNTKAWDEYEEYDRKLQEYNDKKSRGEPAKKPQKPKKPDNPRYSEEEITAINGIKEKLELVINEAPGNEERRKELINSLIEEIDKLPELTKKRLIPVAGFREELLRAAEYKLNDVEKAIMADPSALREIEKLHPVREYTQEEQQRDLNWLSEIKEKDKELNDIFKAEPYAHDKIRQLQELTADNPQFIAEAVKKCIGENAWNEYRPNPGRESDELKAIDILTHLNSQYRVSNNHKLLSDVESEVRSRIISVPAKNVSNIGYAEISHISGQLMYLIPMISPIPDKVIGDEIANVFGKVREGKGFDRQNEFMERLNKVLDSPGELSHMQQREEIGRCLQGLLLPVAVEVQNFKRNDKIFAKDNPGEDEKKKMENSYTRVFGLPGGFISASYAEKLKSVLQLAGKALDRAEELMKADGHEVATSNLKVVQGMIRNAFRGTSSMKVDSMDPVLKIVEANLSSPEEASIDRTQNPIIPGKTKKFTLDEIEEKKDIFPIHKAFNAECEIREIWSEYLAEKQKGSMTREREMEYWNRIDNQYTIVDSVLNDLKAKQEEDPSFVDNNMRFLRGQSNAKDSFRDSITADRGMMAPLRFIAGRRQAVQNGWPLSELGLYSHFEDVVRNIDRHIEAVEEGGDITKAYVNNLKEFRTLLNDKMLGKPYETDPGKRAELFGEIADRIHALDEEKNRLKGIKSLSEDLNKKVGLVIGDVKNVNSAYDNGGMPHEYEMRLAQKDAQIEAVEKARRELDEIKNIADPIVYNELKHLAASHPEAPKQDYTTIDTAFVEKADIYLNSGMGSLAKEIEAVKQGKETTLSAKTGLSHEKAVDKIYDMLNASDSFFHFDSKQYKAVKEGLNKLKKGTATPEERQKLTEDVKTYLTDPNYDRIHKHSKNEFDNTRFNVMFILANELDPAWAKENFNDMNIAALHGEKAANTSFFNVHEYTNFMHRQMADGGFLRSVHAVGSQNWYLRTDSYGQKGLVEEVLRLRQDSAYTETDRLKAELSNLNKLAGVGNDLTEDISFKAKLPLLNQYRQDLDRILNGISNMEEDRLNREKNQMIQVRNNAVSQIKAYLDNPENQKSPIFDKVVLSYGVVDPKGAHNYIADLNQRRNGKEKIRNLNLMTLEAEQGIDIGGRRALNEKKKAARAAQERAEVRNNAPRQNGQLRLDNH